MNAVKLAQAFLFDLVVVARGVSIMGVEDMRARARMLALSLEGDAEAVVVEARDFLTGIGDGVLAIEEYGDRARALAVALEPIAWPVSQDGP